jgi:hypothetical protein
MRLPIQTFSKLEFIFCAFLAENNFVNALILFIGFGSDANGQKNGGRISSSNPPAVVHANHAGAWHAGA